MLANLLIVITPTFSPTLPTPMYFFLTHCSLIDVSLTSVTTSKLIADLLYQRRIISWGACLTQIFLEHFLGGSEIVIIIIMAYDHYVTICKPLHYTTIMRQELCQLLVVVAWMRGILHAMVLIHFILTLTFCGSNDTDHLVCDFFSLLKLAYRLGTLVAANNGAMCKLIFSMLLISYRVILSSLKSYGSEE
ncbi:olfactory receptor 4C3D-like [Muntiacus reevesi]|uniref:olfactory receptor 4C3D-like n=1 Tax=Muntiacus reevesi TaxID=9886 RepID=UPI00330735CA